MLRACDHAASPFDEALVAVTRAELPENIHSGRVCVVSADSGEVVVSYGDPEALAFVRSTAKPLQAIASLVGGVAEACGWDDRHLAMMAASQRGYPAQMAALEQMLASSAVPEDALVFHETKPIASAAQVEWAQNGALRRKLYHTCAGKHLGMLAWCRLAGWPLAGYAEPDHPAQREVLRRVREWCGADEAACRLGRDGCGLPVLAMPLRRIALGYARLACAESSGSLESQESMHASPVRADDGRLQRADATSGGVSGETAGESLDRADGGRLERTDATSDGMSGETAGESLDRADDGRLQRTDATSDGMSGETAGESLDRADDGRLQRAGAASDGMSGEALVESLDREAVAAAARVVSAMQRHPDLVEGPGRLASLLLADPNIVAKSGAQGLFALGLRQERLGIAVHITDGSEAAWPYIVMRLLDRLGGASAATIEALSARFPHEFRNDAGIVAGSWEVLI